MRGEGEKGRRGEGRRSCAEGARRVWISTTHQSGEKGVVEFFSFFLSFEFLSFNFFNFFLVFLSLSSLSFFSSLSSASTGFDGVAVCKSLSIGGKSEVKVSKWGGKRERAAEKRKKFGGVARLGFLSCLFLSPEKRSWSLGFFASALEESKPGLIREAHSEDNTNTAGWARPDAKARSGGGEAGERAAVAAKKSRS